MPLWLQVQMRASYFKFSNTIDTMARRHGGRSVVAAPQPMEGMFENFSNANLEMLVNVRYSLLDIICGIIKPGTQFPY